MSVDSPEHDLQLLLYRQAENAWTQVIRPWLEASRGRLARSYVVVATRGQAYGLKLRCLIAGVPLLGVEFLTPGLARKKWLPLHLAERGEEGRPAAGREVLLLGLRVLIERKLEPLSSQDPAWGFWKSLQSDPDRVLDDFDELLKAGFRPDHFGLPQLREIFEELAAWIARLGYDFAPLQSEVAALTLLPERATRLGGRLLIYGLSAELWSEFPNVAALARRFSAVTAVLPEPEFRGRKQLDENWIHLWEALLGTTALALPPDDTVSSCEAVAQIWRLGPHDPSPANAPLPCRIVVGCTRRDEMELVAEEIAAALSRGAEHVGVIFPSADAAHGVLVNVLRSRGIEFHDTIDGAGASNLETQLQRGLLLFYQRGARLEDVLELWPLLKATGATATPLQSVRDVCDRLFDEKQTHALAAYQDIISASDRPEWREVARIVQRLLPPFPKELSLAEALDRFTHLCAVFDVPFPPNLGTLRVVSERETRNLPSSAVLAAMLSFIPEASPLVRTDSGTFARVTLLTRRRAEGLAFSHLFLTESNAGVWPRRSESSPWLPDEYKEKLNASSRFSLGVFTSEDRASLEKQGYGTLARDTLTEIVFSAALYDEAQPESRLAANSWVERVLWSDPQLRTAECDLEQLFQQLAVSVAPTQKGAVEGLDVWRRVWASRRDPKTPFDDFFFAVDPARIRPDVLSARLIERSVQDPADLWFDAVLGARRTEWKSLARARKKAIGQWVHRVLALVLQPDRVAGVFGEKREYSAARTKLREELDRVRANWPANQYWDSFCLELGRACETLLEAVYRISGGNFVAAELPLPWKASVPIGQGERLRVRGRVDLAWFDRPDWQGAVVEIVDFKTGGDAALSAQRMANDGFALQLGVYLAAAQSLGIRDGRVWMLKPELDGFSSLDLAALPKALSALAQLGRHLRTGVYGALTPDASDYAPIGRVWPLACVPIPEEILLQKFLISFPPAEGEVPFE